MTADSRGAQGWRPDPFGRHEVRFHDGTRWTPYVKDGEKHTIDEPGERVGSVVTGVRTVVGESVLVVEQHVDLRRSQDPYAVYAADGHRVATVRPVDSGARALEVVDSDGARVLTLARPAAAPAKSATPAKSAKSIVVVRDLEAKEIGRIVEQHLPGVTTFTLEGGAGGHAGYVRARSWAGWDIRLENDRGREVGRINRSWDGLDRTAFPTPDNYVVRLTQPLPEPLRTLAAAAGVVLSAALTKDARGFI